MSPRASSNASQGSLSKGDEGCSAPAPSNPLASKALLASGLEGAGAEQPSSPLLNEPCEALLEALGDIGDGSSSNLAVHSEIATAAITDVT